MCDSQENGLSTVVYGGRTIGYVIRTGRCKSVRIVVKGPDEVVVSAPSRVSAKTVRAFVERQAGWILQTMEKQALRPRLAPRAYTTGEIFYFLGRPLRLEVTRSVWKTVTREENVLRVTLYDTANTVRVRTLVEGWFREQAQSVLSGFLSDGVARFGERICPERGPLAMRSEEHPAGVRLTVRAMKTRWGSCSRDGHITLSVELAHMPPRLIEYVVVHELCHLAQLNHSAAFYFRVARCLPDWRERRRELETRSWLKERMPG